MFTVTKSGTNRLDIEFGGKLDSEQMKRALDELLEKSKDIENGLMLYDVVEFRIPSLAAIAVEFSRLPSMFGFIRKFKRAAVLTDKRWIKRISEFKGRFIRGLEIKGFARNEKEQANAWLSEANSE